MNVRLYPVDEHNALDEMDQEELSLIQREQTFVLQRLRPRHMEVCSLIAQGVKGTDVAAITGYTTTYVSMLMRQPVCIAYVQQLNEAVGQQLEMMYGKAVTVISDAMQHGTVGEQLKAVRLHGELTKRIGSREILAPSSEDSNARLVRLAERLTGLLHQANMAEQGRVINGTCEEVSRPAELQWSGLPRSDQAEEAGGDERSEGH